MKFPTRIEEVTVDWLQASLGGHTADPTVEGFTSEPLGDGVGLLGQLERISLQWSGDGDSHPATVVAKFAAETEGGRAIASLFSMYEREVGFYSELVHKTSTRVPACYASHHDPGNQTVVLLLEDISAGHLADQLIGANQAQVEATAEELVKLHASWWEDPALKATTWLHDLNHPLYVDGLPTALDLSHPPASQILDLPDWYDQFRRTVPNWLQRGAEMPWTLTHGDPRLDNLIFDAYDEALVIIDWQLIARTPGISDIAHFMSQSVPVALRREIESDVVTHYRDRLVELGVEPPARQELWDAYRLSVASGLNRPVIAAGNIDRDDERAMDLVRTMLDRSVTATEDLGAVALLV